MSTQETGIDDKSKNKIIAVLSALFPDARIYLFGSRATGKFSHGSDIDIAIDAGVALERVDVGEARDMFGESNIPFRIDVVDLNRVPKDMKDTILKKGILWKS
jgi:predicted nucleotidyltransferase